jgi:hypothetical protein
MCKGTRELARLGAPHAVVVEEPETVVGRDDAARDRAVDSLAVISNVEVLISLE